MFAILDVKSAYSFFDGTMAVEDIVKTAKSLNYVALAINDTNNLHGLMDFKNATLKHKITPLYSLRVLITDNDVEITYLLYAKNNEGYKDLLKLSTRLNSIDDTLNYSDLIEYTNDCVVIVYGEGGIIETPQINTRVYLELYQETLNDFYIGISNNNSNKWKVDNDNLKLMCYSMNIKTVALPKVEFKNSEDSDTKRLYIAMKHNRLFKDHQNYVNEKNYFMSVDDIKKYYDQGDIDNTIEIMNKCNVNFDSIEKAVLPTYVNPLSVSSDDYLTSLCLKGLELRLNHVVSQKYSDRLKYELSIIIEMGFSDYFLIVYDTILFARKNNIYVGPGRGSSASSLTAYVLGITHIDPLKYGLLFERFLNPERISLPDIDIDFPDDKRNEIIDYVIQKYGSDNVAQITTYGTFAARQALRDVGKALNVPVYKLDQLSKLISNEPRVKLESVYNKNHNFKKMVDKDRQLTELFNLAQKIEGLPRHTSVHAAGIVMSKDPLVNHLPLLEISDDYFATQYSMNYLEELGLNKIDFLGLRNLSIIAEVVSEIDDFNILEIPLDDHKTYELLQKGDTAGLFQLESYGMTKLLVDMKPDKFTDIIAAIALYRPGPMANIPTYLENRKTPSKISYIHKDLEPILSETYGVIVYQEQIMQIAQTMANFPLAKADILRQAMSKKQASLLTSLREEFILGSLKKGYTKKVAVEVYDLIEKFANYGFNKAHSSAYSLISYQMAYLKANYYLQFYLSLLNGVIGSSSKTFEYTKQCRKVNINIFGPNVNYSETRFIKSSNSILFPLISIKGVGMVVAKKLIEERDKGLFTDYFDFIARVNVIGISKGIIEALIHAGALDTFDLNRTTMLEMLDQALMYASLVMVDSKNPSLDFNIVSKPNIIKYERDNYKELEAEKDVLGFYLSTHPIEQYKTDINYRGDNIQQTLKASRTNELLVYILSIRTHRTKYGDLMAFVQASDESGTIDLVMMPNIFEKNEELLKVNTYIVISGRIDREESVLVNSLKIIERKR